MRADEAAPAPVSAVNEAGLGVPASGGSAGLEYCRNLDFEAEY